MNAAWQFQIHYHAIKFRIGVDVCVRRFPFAVGSAGQGGGRIAMSCLSVPLAQRLAKEKFNPDMFAGVFTGGKAPPWLDGLAADAEGRQLIYQLSSEHRNCLLLSFAIQKILYQGVGTPMRCARTRTGPAASPAAHHAVPPAMLRRLCGTAILACGGPTWLARSAAKQTRSWRGRRRWEPSGMV
jgi:TH1 protein